ncbi:MAG: hypothetical protein M3R25_08860 [Bacteroidota bacterium]|nr:hypothetical protein [Bacteroidota bacterium]
MPSARSTFISNVIAAVILYATVIVYQGYQYGQNDQTQILPVLYEQDHPGTYLKDHYVQAYLESYVNERTIFHFLLRHVGYESPWLVFIWHAISAIALILAWIYIAGRWIKQPVWQWICIGMILTLGFHTATGSNEIYYNQFVPSLPAKALGSWGLYCWLQKKYYGWSILIILSGLLQPLVGIQLFLITCAATLINYFFGNEKTKLPIFPVLIYLIFTLPWIVLLAKNNGGTSDPGRFMDIIHFRLGHHFFGFTFSAVDLLFTLLFSLICIIYYHGKLKWMFVLIVAGCLIYEFGVEWIRSPLVLYTQWWKTTIWIEAFAFIAIFSMVDQRIRFSEKYKHWSPALPVLLLLAVSFYRLSNIVGVKPDYSKPLSSAKTDAVDISIKARELTPDTALFVIPYELTAFRWYSHRSNYIDWKAMLHNETFLYEWYDRVSEIYAFDMQAQAEGQTILSNASAMLSDPDAEHIARWKSLGITHVTGYPGKGSGMDLLSQNATYALFRLR